MRQTVCLSQQKGVHMVYTVTFNPALDYVVHLEKPLLSGETNRSSKEEFYFGGKGINVSIVLNNLGIDSVALGFIAGFTGRAIERGIRRMGIQTDFIELEGGISRINVKIKSEKETEINSTGPRISHDDIMMLFRRIDQIRDGDTLVLAGSIPNTLPDDIYEKILERLDNKNITKVVDATGDLLLKVLPFQPFLIKPNRAELGELFGRSIETDDEIIEYAGKLQKRGARNVLVSLGAKGAILIPETGDPEKIGVPEGKVLNTVGAGDSMVAGFLTGYMQTGSYKKALYLGTAAGSATSVSEGLGDKATIMKQLEKINSGRMI